MLGDSVLVFDELLSANIKTVRKERRNYFADAVHQILRGMKKVPELHYLLKDGNHYEASSKYFEVV